MRKFNSLFAVWTTAIFSLFLLGTADVKAQDAAQVIGNNSPSSSNEWSFRLAPYAWLTGMTGDATVKGVESDVNVTLAEVADLADNIQGALMLAGEARHGLFGITSDVIFLKLADTEATPRGVLFDNAKVELTEVVWTNYASYRVLESGNSSLDLLAGARLMYLDSSLSLKGNLLQSRELDGSKTWVDPLVGFRAITPLGEQFAIRLLGDIGGFGVSSDLTWQALSAVSYQFTGSNASIGMGYRAIGYDYSSGEFGYNIISHGPFLGAEWVF